MAWDDIQDEYDCITPDEWNNMVAAIKCPEKGIVDFLLYSDCSNETGRKFKFTYSGDDSILEGGASTTEDLVFKANSTDTYPFLTLEGNAEIYLDVASEQEIMFREDGDQFFLFDKTGDDSLLYGGGSSTNDLKILANSSDTYPFILLEGAGDIFLEVPNEEEIAFREGGAQFFLFDKSGDDSFLKGGSTTSDDMLIYANSTDASPYIVLEGNMGIENRIHAGAIFKITTSIETLFEVDTGTADKHFDFHQHDAHQFVLENRTSDPGAPVAGQMWFRTDL